ncbi:phosphonate metabolism transcriptional regulator PhnF [Rhizobium sp. LjRoot254]|uniref:phosphonate metabolism transcriptional regulator PhnF n=1 Tax=Rhizobium sp. LjRoot254 TaxID=3342297 RepID=UPI003ECFED6E
MNEHFPIDRRRGISAWKQIADQVSRSIMSGEYDETGMVPPETVLAERFGVNRHTVRNAIAALAEDGMLRRVQGRGTLIEKRERLVYPVGRRTRFSDGLGSQAQELAMRLLSAQSLAAPEQIAAALGIPATEAVLKLETLSMADGDPISLSSHYFDERRFPEMAIHFERFHSITRALAEQGVEDYVRISTEVTGRLATTEESSRLRLSSAAVVLETLAVNADSSGQPIQFSRTIFAAERITLKLDTQGP